MRERTKDVARKENQMKKAVRARIVFAIEILVRK